MNKNDSIFVAGHKGMVGSAILRRLQKDGYTNIITRTRQQLDLLDQRAVFAFFESNRIDGVFMAAARVGGVYANNTYRADFIYENLTVQNNVIWGAFKAGVKNLLFLGSSCIYPTAAAQPLKEEYLLTGALEPTNEPYAIAKIAGIKLCESLNRQYGSDYRSVMPTNLYGPNDNYNLQNSHVLPALIRKFHLAKLAEIGDGKGILYDEETYGPIPEDIRHSLNAIAIRNGQKTVYPQITPTRLQKITQIEPKEGFTQPSAANLEPGTLNPECVSPSSVLCPLPSEVPPAVILWGSGAPYREFLHVDDMAGGCIHVMQMEETAYQRATTDTGVSFVNVGSGADATIAELAALVKTTIGFTGDMVFDSSKPDGMYRKRLDVSRINAAGWKASIALEDGIRTTYEEYLSK
ncbi:MAG: GDP-L-fucose synthase [Pseudomonadota bacterium]